jgi:hypothetical protein
MTLEVYKLLGEINQAAEVFEEQRDEYIRLAEKARNLLDEFSTQLDILNNKVRVVRVNTKEAWRGAAPVDEPVGAAFDPPNATLSSVSHIIATDGSQIFPDRHGIAHYALIHVGVFHLRPGSGEAPATSTYPELLYGQRLIDEEKEESLLAADISRERDMQELGKLVELSVAQVGTTVALMDSPLLLWMLQPDPKEKLLEWFVDQLRQAEMAGVLLAGYIDRPGSRGVADLLALAQIPDNAITRDNPDLRVFREMPDRAIFHSGLKPGQRSALFVSTSPFNAKLRSRNRNLQVAFFYINVGQRNDPVLARVETPFWVAKDKDRLNQLHAAIWGQCQAPGRYPYALARAHEIAIVNREQREELENILINAMLARGLSPRVSAKSSLKQLTDR